MDSDSDIYDELDRLIHESGDGVETDYFYRGNSHIVAKKIDTEDGYQCTYIYDRGGELLITSSEEEGWALRVNTKAETAMFVLIEADIRSFHKTGEIPEEAWLHRDESTHEM